MDILEILHKMPIINCAITKAQLQGETKQADCMLDSTIRKVTNTKPTVDEMTPYELYRFQTSLLGFFCYKGWTK